MHPLFLQHLDASKQLVSDLASLADPVAMAAASILETLRNGGQLLVCGNGGSAADASHFAAELVGRFQSNRRSYPAMALAETASTVTAIANDFDYEQVFSRQVEAFGRPGDLLCVFTTSGHSPNVLRALDVARAGGLRTIGFYGRTGGAAVARTDLSFCVPSDVTTLIQEGHKLLMHVVCEIIEPELVV